MARKNRLGMATFNGDAAHVHISTGAEFINFPPPTDITTVVVIIVSNGAGWLQD